MTVESSELTKIVHVVSDIGRAATSFSSLLGMTAPRIVDAGAPADGSDPGNRTWFRGRTIGGRVRIANLEMGPVTVELIEPVDRESPWAEHLRRHGEGIFSIVFTVTDFEGHIRRLEAEGMPMYHRGEYGSGRYAYFESKDRVGVTICVQELGPAAG